MKMVQRYPDVFVLITPAQRVGGKFLNKTASQKRSQKYTYFCFPVWNQKSRFSEKSVWKFITLSVSLSLPYWTRIYPWENNVYPDQLASVEAIWSDSTLFSSSLRNDWINWIMQLNWAAQGLIFRVSLVL